MGGGNNGIWINASTVNTFLTRFGGSSRNTRELISVALANKFLYYPCKSWVHIGGGKSLFDFSRKALPKVLFMLLWSIWLCYVRCEIKNNVLPLFKTSV